MTMLMTGCGGSGNAPAVPVYSQEFKTAVADEMKAIGKPQCPRNQVMDTCSALRAWAVDYIKMIRKIEASE